MEPGQGRAAARAWLRGEQRAGKRAARPVLLLSLLGSVLAIGQAWCIAFLLADGLTSHPAALATGPATDHLGLAPILGLAPAPGPTILLLAFAVAALLRAGLAYATEVAAF